MKLTKQQQAAMDKFVNGVADLVKKDNPEDRRTYIKNLVYELFKVYIKTGDQANKLTDGLLSLVEQKLKDNGLQLIPENKIGNYLKFATDKIERGEKTHSVCPRCGRHIETYDIPYAYDPVENAVVFVTTCPHCLTALYSK